MAYNSAVYELPYPCPFALVSKILGGQSMGRVSPGPQKTTLPAIPCNFFVDRTFEFTEIADFAGLGDCRPKFGFRIRI